MTIFLGDNLLTAVNVARDCEMLPIGERVILVTASPPVGDTPASINYSLAEMYEAEETSEDSTDSLGSVTSDSNPLFTDSWPDSIFQPMENISRIWQKQIWSTSELNKFVQPRMHLAMCGKTLDVVRKNFPDVLPKILCRGTVFARMSPDQKTKVTFLAFNVDNLIFFRVYSCS